MNPVKDEKQEKKPLKIIFSLEEIKFFEITRPNKNDPINETIK